jgi:hypothetical protein
VILSPSAVASSSSESECATFTLPVNSSELVCAQAVPKIIWLGSGWGRGGVGVVRWFQGVVSTACSGFFTDDFCFAAGLFEVGGVDGRGDSV